MESETESREDERAKSQDSGSSEAPVGGQPGGGLDGPEGDVAETDDSPVASPEADDDGSAETSTDEDETSSSGIGA